MQGKVLEFNLQSGEGVIAGDDSTRYSFVRTEWKSTEIHPMANVMVDFEVSNGSAVGIYTIEKIVPASVAPSGSNVFTKYYIGVLKNYVKFDGRARREEFWYFFLFNFIISLILGSISAGVLSTIYALGVLIPSIAVGVRRLHDTNRSGLWHLIILVPLIGTIWFIVLCILNGTPGYNRFGPNPKEL